MASPTKLTSEQRATLLTWLAADYDSRLIRQWFKERKWPELSDRMITYYRHSRDGGIARLRQERRNNALTMGLALKEERIARLAAHADALDAIKWEPDDRGRLWNEKAWRECLADIASEMGHRTRTIEIRDWREAAKQSGLENPDEALNEIVGIIAARMAKANAGGGDREGEGVAAEQGDTEAGDIAQ